MGNMVPNKMKRLAVVAGQGGFEELRRAGRVRCAQVLPTRVEAARIGVDQSGMVGEGDCVKVVDSQPAFSQAPLDRLLGKLPRREGHRALAVLATAEPFLLSSCN